MSEHQARALTGDTTIRGRFRPNAEGDDIALPLYRDFPTAAFLEPTRGPNRKQRRNAGRSANVPRVNEAKRALRNVAVAL